MNALHIQHSHPTTQTQRTESAPPAPKFALLPIAFMPAAFAAARALLREYPGDPDIPAAAVKSIGNMLQGGMEDRFQICIEAGVVPDLVRCAGNQSDAPGVAYPAVRALGRLVTVRCT